MNGWIAGWLCCLFNFYKTIRLTLAKQCETMRLTEFDLLSNIKLISLCD
jgi:hypothetical protein